MGRSRRMRDIIKLAVRLFVFSLVAGGLEPESHFKFVVPGNLLFIVEVGVNGHGGEQGVVAFTAFIPVVGNIVLSELKREVCFEGPEVWFSHDDAEVCLNQVQYSPELLVRPLHQLLQLHLPAREHQ